MPGGMRPAPFVPIGNLLNPLIPRSRNPKTQPLGKIVVLVGHQQNLKVQVCLQGAQWPRCRQCTLIRSESFQANYFWGKGQPDPRVFRVPIFSSHRAEKSQGNKMRVSLERGKIAHFCPPSTKIGA
jgi:hypothetical protein